MRNVNALEVRNHLGSILDELENAKEPILVSKGRRIRAVLVTPEDFQKRFLDRQTEERRQEILRRVKAQRATNIADKASIDILRELRGYRD